MGMVGRHETTGASIVYTRRITYMYMTTRHLGRMRRYSSVASSTLHIIEKKGARDRTHDGYGKVHGAIDR